METIEIDFDVHQLIEMERRSFEEPKLAALRRLLKLPVESGAPAPVPAKSGRAWFGKGVELPHGTKLRMEYNGRTYDAEITDGVWVSGKERFKSPSGAASGLAITKQGTKTKLDGWGYWEAQLPGSAKWVSILTLWRRAHP